MPTVAQRRVLVVAAAVALVGFAYQPKLDLLGEPIGFWAFDRTQQPGFSSGGGMTPDYRMLGTVELVALAFVTACLYLAGGERE